MYHNVKIDPSAYIVPSANIVGNVTLGEECVVLFNATLRGDCNRKIVVGDRCNFQESVCVHVSIPSDTIIGNDVTVGHGAIIHGCTIEDECIIGMGSIILDNAHIGKHCLVGAGALVTGGFVAPEGSLILGSPAKVVRALRDEEIAGLKESADEYVEIGRNLHAEGLAMRGSDYTME